ncbi:hypothetical protein HKX48_007974 [Thoreauomyces humboldtii]|nr:hypothetical protein HKX48_007974 [Thoreauomyces humboldtii]
MLNVTASSTVFSSQSNSDISVDIVDQIPSLSHGSPPSHASIRSDQKLSSEDDMELFIKRGHRTSFPVAQTPSTEDDELASRLAERESSINKEARRRRFIEKAAEKAQRRRMKDERWARLEEKLDHIRACLDQDRKADIELSPSSPATTVREATDKATLAHASTAAETTSQSPVTSTRAQAVQHTSNAFKKDRFPRAPQPSPSIAKILDATPVQKPDALPQPTPGQQPPSRTSPSRAQPVSSTPGPKQAPGTEAAPRKRKSRGKRGGAVKDDWRIEAVENWPAF